MEMLVPNSLSEFPAIGDKIVIEGATLTFSLLETDSNACHAQNKKYSHLTYRLTYLATKPALVAKMFLEISKEYLSTFNGEAIMRYIKDFARILMLTEDGFNDTEFRIITGLSDKTIREYNDLMEPYSTEDYQERLTQLRAMF